VRIAKPVDDCVGDVEEQLVVELVVGETEEVEQVFEHSISVQI
jgi:hypothetical protein